MTKTKILFWVFCLWIIVLWGCNSKEVWDEKYDLTTEIGRQLNCIAQFQKENKDNSYSVEWLKEVINEGNCIVEWRVQLAEQVYNLVCNYPKDRTKWIANFTPLNSAEIWNPASDYCLSNWWSYQIVSNDIDIYGECAFSDWSSCEQWNFYNWVCMPWDSLNGIYYTNVDKDGLNREGKPIAKAT